MPRVNGYVILYIGIWESHFYCNMNFLLAISLSFIFIHYVNYRHVGSQTRTVIGVGWSYCYIFTEVFRQVWHPILHL